MKKVRKRKKIVKDTRQVEKEELQLNHRVTMRLVEIVIERLHVERDLIQKAILDLSRVLMEEL